MQDSLLLDLETTKLIPMPEWGYFGDKISITSLKKEKLRSYIDANSSTFKDRVEDEIYDLRDIVNSVIYCQQEAMLPKTPDHKLNVRWGGLCKDLVYGGGRYVVMPGFKHLDKTYFHGDTFLTSCTSLTLEDEKKVDYHDWSSGYHPDIDILKFNSELSQWQISWSNSYYNVFEIISPWHCKNISVEEALTESISRAKKTFNIGNLLIEYSKHLRGEENRLEELEGLIKM